MLCLPVTDKSSRSGHRGERRKTMSCADAVLLFALLSRPWPPNASGRACGVCVGAMSCVLRVRPGLLALGRVLKALGTKFNDVSDGAVCAICTCVCIVHRMPFCRSVAVAARMRPVLLWMPSVLKVNVCATRQPIQPATVVSDSSVSARTPLVLFLSLPH